MKLRFHGRSSCRSDTSSFSDPFESNTLICATDQFSERLQTHANMMLKTVENDFPRSFLLRYLNDFVFLNDALLKQFEVLLHGPCESHVVCHRP